MTLQVQASWEAVLLDWARAAMEAHVPVEKSHAESHTLAAAYRYCEAVTREHSKTFYVASALLPYAQRRAARALYAFCRVTDNIIDKSDDAPDVRRANLEAWRALTTSHHPPADELVALAWTDARTRCNIPSGYADQLIDGVARDLEQKRYQTFDDLAAYSYGVASTVGLMAMHIIGFSGADALPYAVKLGVALQITNILRDVKEDWDAGRLYLPLEELAVFGLSEADIDAGRVDARWRDFMRFQIARVRRLYDEAYPGIALLHPRGRFAIAAAADLYRAILCDIEAHDYDVFSRRAHVGTAGKIAMLPGIYYRSQRL